MPARTTIPIGLLIGAILLGANIPAVEQQTLWRRTFSGDTKDFSISPFGSAVVDTHEGLVALDLETGQIRWSRPDVSHYKFVPEARHAFVTTKEGLSVLDLETGQDRWNVANLKFSKVSGFLHLPTRGMTLVYGETSQSVHTLMSVHTESGEIVWRQDNLYTGSLKPETARKIVYTDRQPPTLDPSTLILDPTHDGLLCLEADSGRLRWRIDERTIKEPNAYSEGSAIMLGADGRLFIPTQRTVLAVNAVDGSILWKAKNLPRRVAQMEMTSAGLVVRGSYEIKERELSWHPYLALLDPATGHTQWSTEQGSGKFEGRSSFLIQSDKIVIALKEGLASFDLATGTPGRTTPMPQFRGGEYPCCLEALPDGRFLITASQNARVADLAGKVFYSRYFKAPGGSLLTNMAMVALIGAVAMATGAVGDPSELFERYKATVRADRFIYMLTDEPSVIGLEGISLVRLDKRSGRDTGRVWFSSRSPTFKVDSRTGIVLVSDGHALTAHTFAEQ